MKSKITYKSVQEFYAGKSVFITGGSGFLGKVLVEKLLYSCPQVGNIYLLLRDKKNLSEEQRIKDLIDSPVFSRLKAERPEDLKKLVLVKGELSALNLNMSPADYETVINNVSIVIHMAAAIKFNEPLKVAMTVNLEGTRKILQLCKNLHNCDAFVYFSTAYSNCNRSVVEEEIYPPPATVDEVYKLLKQEPNDEDVTSLLNGLPNTYTFTKALAENLVSETHGDIPTVIIRPSIVTASKSEPSPGWVDNWFGPTGIMTPTALGISRTVYTEYDYNIDLIPVDYVCNLTLVAATKAERSTNVAVYNSCTGSLNPVSIGHSLMTYVDVAHKDKFNILPFPHLVVFTKQRWLIKFIGIIMFFIAYIMDIGLRFLGKKRILEKIFNQSVMVQNILAFFTSHSWVMKSSNALKLANSLSPEDYQKFPCNPQDIVWEEYIPVYYQGVKKNLIEKAKLNFIT